MTLDRVGDLDDADVCQAEEVSALWRNSRTPERGFSMALSRFGGAEDSGCVLVRAWSRAGDLMAVLQLVPGGPTACPWTPCGATPTWTTG